MRTFSDFEKKIIKRMIELDRQAGSLIVLNNIMDSLSKEIGLQNHWHITATSRTNVSIHIREELVGHTAQISMQEIEDKIWKFVLTTFKLLEYLEDNKLIYLLGNSRATSIGNIQSDVKYVECDFLEEEAKILVYNYIGKRIYVTEDLKELARSNFKSKEQIDREKELRYTRIALLIAFLGILASILAPFWLTSTVRIANQIKTNTIECNLKKIHREISSLSSAIERKTGALRETNKTVPKGFLHTLGPAETVKSHMGKNNSGTNDQIAKKDST